MHEASSYDTHIFHLARLSLLGSTADVESYVHQIARTVKASDPKLANDLTNLLKKHFAANAGAAERRMGGVLRQ